MKPKRFAFIRFLTLAFLMLGTIGASAQAIFINAPQPTGNTNNGSTDPWTAICASDTFNDYFVNVTWFGTANGGNEFILELSDNIGSFANAVELARVDDQNGNTDFDINFAITTDVRGNGYKMRVRSTNPAKIGDESPAYPMYYMDVTTNLNISELGNGVPPGSICSVGAITLQVDNIPNPETYQYIWYRSGSPLGGENAHTLTVSQSGIYQAFIFYGNDCTGSGNTDSNFVDVTIGSTGQGIFINPPTQTALCSGDTEVLSINTTDPSWTYKWYRDGNQMVGATTSTYTVDASVPGFEGDYQVEISSPSICTERSAAIAITNADNFTVTRVNDANMVLLPSETKTLSISTNAIGPTYKWYRNGTEIVGATGTSYDASQAGTYYAVVTQSGGTCPGTIKNSETTEVVVPASFEFIADYASAYTACTNTDIVLEVQTINAVLSDNSTVDVTTDVASSFTYQWTRTGSNVAGATSSSISLTATTENGDYAVEGVLSTYNTTSNTLPVQLLTNETVTISSTSTIYCNSTDTVTISTTTDLTGETFAWQRDGTDINSTDTTLNVTELGTYRLVVDKNGCDLISNEINITPLNPDLITMDPIGDIIFPEGTSRTVTASGGTSYRWYDANNVEISISDSVTFTEEGTYTLIANIDNCEITRQVNVEYLDTFKVPNVITPNGDGSNDQWVLPNSYSNKTDVNVIIYNDKGIELLNVTDYRNNWPESSMTFPSQNMVFYYVIKNANETLKQGTITVIR
ncbi:gliding motility-associated C-terminal domain-containing protein [Maribacter halichondriae]|uniref:T9SS type B sorting domain-containing protein n=1 Tax=Maribacter halichondriae TaxID=2980554 RepID=UPI0023598B3A|nr:gliding motility-associated C-terminal domain-containing protein [Maribacter sp. Hal144]